jgi:hypothetical protein
MKGGNDEKGPNEASSFVWALGEYFFFVFFVTNLNRMGRLPGKVPEKGKILRKHYKHSGNITNIPDILVILQITSQLRNTVTM